MVNKKFDLYKEPYIRKADYKYYGTNNIMIDFVIALLPIILIGWFQNGVKVFMDNKSIYTLFKPLLFIIFGGLFSFLLEALYFYFKNFYSKNKKNNELEYNPFEASIKSYSIIPGLLLSLILPLSTPIWVLFIGCFFSNIIAKMIFGGFGHNIFNPALVGYIFVMTAFYSVISNNNINSDIISSSTPLSELNNILSNKISITDVINNKGLLNICFGLNYGTFAEVSSIACFISYIYLVIRKVIDYKMPLICLFSFFISSLLIGYFINTNGLLFALYNLFNGGIIFGAIFMVTEPVTSPRSVIGKYIYSIFIGLLVLVLRLLSDLQDGTSTAILFMNMLSFIIDNVGAKIRVENNMIKKLKTISIFALIFILLNCYSILKINTMKVSNDNNGDINNGEVNDEKIEITNIRQDYSKLNDGVVEFIYTVIVNNKTYLYNCDMDGNVKIDNNEYEDDEIKTQIEKVIMNNKVNKRSTNKNKHIGYITEVDKISDNEYIITANSRGYVNDVIITITYKDNEIIDTIVDIQKETQLNGALPNANGTKEDLINIGKGNRSDIVSNVTYTSVSLFSCRKAIIDYINNVLGGNNE